MNHTVFTCVNSPNDSDIKIDAPTLVTQLVSVAATNDETQPAMRKQEEIIAWAKHAQASNGFG